MNEQIPIWSPLSITRLGPPCAVPLPAVVAVPARNEVERLPKTVAALTGQTGLVAGSTGIVLLLNNCTDGTLDAVKAMQPLLRVPVWAVEIQLPPSFANAGWARRAAMEYAAGLVAPGGVILTTDADTIPDPDWVAQMLSEFGKGADAVAGYVTADWDELGKLPAPVLERGAIEWEYQNLAVEVESRADPRPHDPWPRHNQNCGANAAITLEFYRAIGGLPPDPVGEDRALFNEVRLRDGKIRHSLRAHVLTSARTEGRAFGGMADALRLRDDPDYPCDDILEVSLQTLRRNRLRSKLRKQWENGCSPAAALRGAEDAAGTAGGPFFGDLWQAAERDSPALARVPLTSRNMRGELAKMRRLVERLRRIKSS